MRSEKIAIVEEIRSRVAESHYVVLAEYKGMKVANADELRRRLKKINSRFHVVSNAFWGKATSSFDWSRRLPALTGSTAMIVGQGDICEAARMLKDFRQDCQSFKVKLGVMDGAVLSAADMDELVRLPSRLQLYAMLAGALAGPMSQLAGVFRQTMSGLLNVLKAVEEKKKSVNPQ
ncbi:MAG: 50S ribosomal protein L10 [Lentisphaerae bacterium]|nr:50S ribosomal protein L10 [Lentisphaerota bacterium]